MTFRKHAFYRIQRYMTLNFLKLDLIPNNLRSDRQVVEQK